ncbi:vesicle fusion-related protein [Trichosporon asahii var. asahii CBS 2479]|uniref:Vesicle fusion-related protein n=1 Tax=Trichosporon asahii var. asahii (strain ATCC 90039 / CBS 2479 / JCM 2466 / KCTC 7840 / NBRC 103889/ NCYC 2677 / UAMH 7654) TaxID=1186058 RepID=J6EQI4_TRIAS|nr:vesicle fusion-related protein [Trichosporon asahii var. asahii CBS 2479]EJT46744.1 vesicle fusion-related protein [Trichosporon asahii var. asahii CBS 2479]
MATFSASAAVGEVLRQPDDLLKLTTYRNKLLKEKAALDNKLQEEIEKLMNTKDESDVFQKITRVSAVHRNFAQTAKMVEQLQSMADKVDYLGRLLDDDRSQGPISDAPHLLPIHFQLQQLESFRNETMAEAKRGNREEREILTRWFEPLDVLIKEFEGWMWELASNVVELARQGYGGTVVRLVKIIEFEGREDEKTVALRLVRKVGNDAARLRGVQGNARPIKNYRHKFLDAIEKNIKGKFADHYDRNELDLLGFIDGLDFMYKDIIRIKDDVEHLFPPDFEAVKWLIHRYHLALDEVLKKVVSSAPEAQVLLELYAWTKEYTRSMKELEVPSEWLQPPLLDGKAGDLLEDYVRLIITKLEEWTVNLQKQETAKFRTRTEEPSRGTDGLFGMDGVVDFFSIVNQQIDLALDSNQGAVLARVVTEAQAEKRPEEVAGGLVEYVMALANDQLRAADFTEALQNRLEPLVSDKYKPTIVDRFNEAIDGYLDVAKQCTGTLVQFVFNDLRPATRQFMQSGWYNDQLMPQIIETMRDYMGDYQSHLNPSIFEIVIEDLLDAFLITYLTALRRAPPNSLRMPGAVQRLRSDISQVFDFFTLYKPPEELEPSFEIMDQVASMLSASPQMVFMDYWNFAKTHGPQLQFVEAIMRARDDLERGETNEVMDTLKRKVRDEGIEDPQEPTIMVSYVEPTPTDKQVKVLGASGAASLMANISAYAGTMASKAKGMRSERDRERF